MKASGQNNLCDHREWPYLSVEGWSDDTYDSQQSQEIDEYEKNTPISSRYRDLVQRAVDAVYRPHASGHCLWSVVGHVFSVGSTSAIQICKDCGYDPFVKVKTKIKLNA